ncbi:TetR family transcriptional regulator [Microbacterium sp. NPDC079995]|uniref:TetR/AcrR family transcriptional regulator n=1 Tax=unclassified Microbacterium TaxID=2609290 RepID=UPI00344CC4FA
MIRIPFASIVERFEVRLKVLLLKFRRMLGRCKDRFRWHTHTKMRFLPNAKRQVNVLYMRSVLDDSDVAARGRIVSAAIELFASGGFRGTTLRSVAESAGVSAALVVHHFGGKDGVRRECDVRVMRFISEKVDEDPVDVLAAAADAYGPYLARMLSEAGPSADALFDELIGFSRRAIDQAVSDGSMRRPRDIDAQSVTLVMLGLAPFFLEHQLTRWSAGDTHGGLRRIA